MERQRQAALARKRDEEVREGSCARLSAPLTLCFPPVLPDPAQEERRRQREEDARKLAEQIEEKERQLFFEGEEVSAHHREIVGRVVWLQAVLFGFNAHLMILV